ncbi:MAG: nickel-dependent hydrogenase large subunit [Actinobacteria bacterium]|nr:nickel-dependent hydrogenase large subunit [Actinomycetota bacterium]MBU1942269.1 nickel-dependent hydrogenase large subunit [Actinomycetota bacterium]MBU2687382.1 nickel-dependent hydrogenase large subunit [Actinomycetota bacterium]
MGSPEELQETGEWTGQKVRIYPVTRIQGRADIEVFFTPHQKPRGARFRALEYRGFEEMVPGMPALRGPSVMSRLCGPCGLTHQLLSCLAIESALDVEVPQAAASFRELISWLFLAQSHLLTMVYSVLPDYALPMSDVSVRNVAGIYSVDREGVSRLLAALAAFTRAISAVAGLPAHPSVVVPGGTSYLPAAEGLHRVSEMLAEGREDIAETLRLVEMLTRRSSRMIDPGPPLKGFYVTTSADGFADINGDSVTISRFDGEERRVVDPDSFLDMLDKRPVGWSYLVPVAILKGEPCLVGPMARVNLGFGPEAAWACEERARILEEWGAPLDGELLFFTALALEVIWAWENASRLLEGGTISGTDSCSVPTMSESGAVAVLETPRGTALHWLAMDRGGAVAEYRVVSSLQLNQALLDDHLTSVALKEVGGLEISDITSQRLQFAVRSFLPCVSCGTH